MVFVLLVFVCVLAFANGANDNCKGVATLVGFGAARPRQALIWAAVTTACGAVVSYWISGALVDKFSRSLFEAGIALDHGFFVAVLFGALGWVLIATKSGLPVSTTHAITGALLGAGLVAFSGAGIRWGFLVDKFAKPLALSPVLSLAVVFLLAWPVTRLVRRYSSACVCVVPAQQPAQLGGAAGALTMSAAAPAGATIVTGYGGACEAQPAIAAATGSMVASAIHWFSSGMVGFARGWNDAPKIAALGTVAAAAVAPESGRPLVFLLVTAAMAAGGLVAGASVLETLARKVTPLPLAESLAASAVTSTLVSLASWHGLPVSTTHVSTGAIIGAGLKNNAREVRWGKVGEIVLSWLITLPVSGVLASGAKLLLGWL
ncbi:anion permease [Sorangium sp. So ce131]|uniref:inorganic phosphate transporter n=1 Tax=Sorangium sp. So ce131 TaxID=3133282 RepID=UPI003F5DC217